MATKEPDVPFVQVKGSFKTRVYNEDVTFRDGDLVEADHPVVRKWPERFGPLLLRYPKQRRAVESSSVRDEIATPKVEA